MCGRYTITTPTEQLAERFEAAPPAEAPAPRYNAAPTQGLPVLLNKEPGQIQLLRWGLIPFWSKDASIGSRMINVRSETAAEKPSFREALRKRRCLVLADGFYEWQDTPEGKQPFRFILASGEPFAFAGIWENWKDPEGNLVRTFAILTVDPNALVAPVHNRMPAMLLPEHERLWLDARAEDEPWQQALRPYPSDLMRSYPVSKLVNSPSNDSEALIAQA
jgi:putative SOS response-associated peptidase YedK